MPFDATPTPPLPIGHQRLLRLAERLEQPDANRPGAYDQRRLVSRWGIGGQNFCGCALGYAGRMPEFIAEGLRFDGLDCLSFGDKQGFDATLLFFALTDSSAVALFGPNAHRGPATTALEVATAIRAYVAEQAAARAEVA